MNIPVRTATKLTCVLSFLLVGGCSTQFERLRNYTGADAGYLLLSLGDNASPTDVPILTGKLVGTEDLIELRTGDLRDPEFVSFPDGVGTIIVRKLIPGQYQLDQVHSSIRDDWIRMTSILPTPIRFSVWPGKTTYIGSYFVSTPIVQRDKMTQRGNIAMVPMAAMQVVVEVSDEHERDLALAKSLHPYLSGATVVSLVPPRAATQ